MKPKTGTIAVIIWEDACIHGSHTFSRKEAEDAGLIQAVTCGILVKQDKERVTIAMDSFPEHDTFRTVQSYPKSCIKQIILKEINPTKQ